MPVLALLGLSLAFSPLASAQEVDLLARIDSATDTLQQLDTQAANCLDDLDEASDNAGEPCVEFLASIDGELLAGYLSHCQVLKTWRDDFVTASLETGSDEPDAAANLELLVGIEFACGQAALQKRTQYVTRAFSRLQDRPAQVQRANSALARRLTELEFESALRAQRRQLQISVQQQRARRELETERQMNDLENELLRQQINRPPALN